MNAEVWNEQARWDAYVRPPRRPRTTIAGRGRG